MLSNFTVKAMSSLVPFQAATKKASLTLPAPWSKQLEGEGAAMSWRRRSTKAKTKHETFLKFPPLEAQDILYSAGILINLIRVLAPI